MPERIANKIILAEDREQQNLVRRYLERCGHTGPFRLVDLPAKGPGGSGEKYVRVKYPEQVRACRSSVGKRASALLVAIVDADLETTQHRLDQLAQALTDAGMPPRGNDEPVVVLIPKRHVETWIRALLGSQADETTDYTKAPYSPPTAADIVNAATELHRQTRPNMPPSVGYPQSLTNSIPEWRRIPP